MENNARGENIDTVVASDQAENIHYYYNFHV